MSDTPSADRPDDRARPQGHGEPSPEAVKDPYAEAEQLAAGMNAGTDDDEPAASSTTWDDEYWTEVSAYIPSGVIEYVKAICRKGWVQRRIMERVDEQVCRRICSERVEAQQTRWANRWRPEQQERTKRMIRRAKDAELRLVHKEQVSDHETFRLLPRALKFSKPNEQGQLVIRDIQIKKPSIGGGSYMEQTPPQLYQWVYEYWGQSRLAGLPEDLGLGYLRKPALWDLTSGSGTAPDLFRTIHGCKIIATDLTVVTGAGITPGDCRLVGRLEAHLGRRGGFGSQPARVIRRPDIILFDPPSRGRPTHAELYTPTHEEAAFGADLALLDRDEYLATIAGIIIEGSTFLAEGGLISYLARCGSRKRGQITADPEMLADLKALLDGQVVITHEMPLVYASVRNQTSLGTARVPAVHMVIKRAP